jgi:hypothetical protein
MPKEQKGCCGGSTGCKVQLLISKAILQEYNSKIKNICMAWIDYKKTFDSMPHSWMVNSLQLTGINNKIISFGRKVMNYWKTSTCLHTEGNITGTEIQKYNVEYFKETHCHH